MTIERLRWWHLAEVVALEPDLFGADEWSLETWLSEVAQPHTDYCVRADAGLVGVAGLSSSPHGEAYVQTLGVARRHQGRGHGTRLLAALVDRAARLGAQTMGLEVRAGNEAALALYARAGFAQVGRRRGYYDRGRADGLVLQCLDLDGALVALGGVPQVRW